MPAVIFFACLDLEQKSSVMDGYYLMTTDPHHPEPLNLQFFLDSYLKAKLPHVILLKKVNIEHRTY